MDEYFPDKVLDKVSLLFLDITAEVMVMAVFHHYVYVGVLYK
jgi:hypothetical protein